MKNEVLREITPLSSKDCILVSKRTKKKFDFPVHTHVDYELNFISRAKGAERIVGDCIEVIDDEDLTLIANPELEHAWVSNKCKSKDIFELTIQFHPELISDVLLQKNQFKPIKELFKKAKNGVSFSQKTIEIIRPQLEKLAEEPRGLRSVLYFMDILYQLALRGDYQVLASEGFSVVESKQHTSRRIEKAYKYIYEHYHEPVYLKNVADYVGMTEISFSRFIKKSMNKNFIDVLIDIRLGHAAKMLIDTTQTIAEICFACGFNNISNFNRTFKRIKECTPKEYRLNYNKNRFLL